MEQKYKPGNSYMDHVGKRMQSQKKKFKNSERDVKTQRRQTNRRRPQANHCWPCVSAPPGDAVPGKLAKLRLGVILPITTG